jgi:hypothetical protein
MTRTKTLAVAVGIVAMSTAGSAIAGKVNIPREGTFEFDYCAVGDPQILANGDKILVSHYRNVANLRTEPPGKPFDRMSSVCYGTYANLTGRQQDFGVCELTDMDGDKWYLEYHGGADGAGGTYTSAYGTGKYDGMTVNGQYVLDFWPAAIKDGFQGCFHNKGTYKLK